MDYLIKFLLIGAAWDIINFLVKKIEAKIENLETQTKDRDVNLEFIFNNINLVKSIFLKKQKLAK